MTYRIGIDIGGTKIHIGLFGEKASGERTLLADARLACAGITRPEEEIRQTIAALCRQTGVAYSEIAFCGVGVPGTVSDDGKKLLKVPNLRILSKDLPATLERALGIPLRVIQDSRAAALGEYLCGNGKGGRVVICMTLGTGIGTGIVIDGKVFAGALGCAGELGHLPVAGGTRPCGCGKSGCLEKYSAGGGLDLTAAEILGENMTAADLFQAAKSGNIKAGKAIERAILLLGNAAVSAVNLLSPDRVLFSGGLSMREDYLTPLIAYIREHCYVAEDKIPFIGKAALGADSPLYGAAFLPL